METVYYTIRACRVTGAMARASGQTEGESDGRTRYILAGGRGRRAPAGKVLRLADYRAPEPEEREEEAAPAGEERGWRPALAWGAEVLATLSIVGAMALLALRVLGM